MIAGSFCNNCFVPLQTCNLLKFIETIKPVVNADIAGLFGFAKLEIPNSRYSKFSGRQSTFLLPPSISIKIFYPLTLAPL